MPKKPRTLDDLAAQVAPTPVADWYAITNEATPEGAPTRALVRIYDAIGGWFGTNARDFVAELDGLDVDELEVHVNSPGGAVWDGVAIMNALKAHRARVQVVVDGLAASAASIVAMGGDEVVMAEGSQMMVHRASGGAWGPAALMRDTAAILDKIDANLAGIYARRAGGSRESWLDVMDAETWYDAAEAVAAGLADRADDSIEAPDAEAAFDLSIFTYAGRSHAPAPPRRPAAMDLRAVAIAPSGVHVAGFAADLTQSPVSTEPGNANRKEDAMASDTFLAGLRERLGITDAGLDEDGLLAALDEALTEQATNETPVIPEGTVLVDADKFAALQAQAAEGALVLAQQVADRRDALVAAAVADGRVAPVNAPAWRARLDENEDGTVVLLGTLPTNKLPVAEIGYTGGEDASSEDALYNKAWGPTRKEA